MANLNTTYMGLELSSPVIVGASGFSRRIDSIKKAEDSGAGALVIYSIFQEEIEREAEELDEALDTGSEIYAESLSYFPHMDFAGTREHIMWVEKARKAVQFPIIGSLNAYSTGEWVEYGRQLQNAGCNALELNLYSIETELGRTCEDIENQWVDVVSAVASSVSIPVAVKMSPWITSIPYSCKRIVEAGAKGLVLFNRFYQPTIDPTKESVVVNLDLSTPEELRLPLRWVAILSSKINADLAASTGVHTGYDVVRQILAGASATQSVSTFYKNGLQHIGTMNEEISTWMDVHSYKNIDDFKGKLSQEKVKDPYTFERAQYVRLLLGRA